jgi:uncharacterized phage-associated protein
MVGIAALSMAASTGLSSMSSASPRAASDKSSPVDANVACVASASLHTVAAELRRRLPGVGVLKLHKLLYYVQGYHLAAIGRPAFNDTICAYENGPLIPSLWSEEKTGDWHDAADVELGEAELNTIGYVVSRYGALSGTDLIHLTHAERPWQDADRSSRDNPPLDREVMREYFAEAARSDADEELDLDPEVLSSWLAGAKDRLIRPSSPDSTKRLRSRFASG